MDLDAAIARLRECAERWEQPDPDDIHCVCAAAARAAGQEPVAWMYETKTGFRTIHWADRLHREQLENDMKAAVEYPLAHKVEPLYAVRERSGDD